MKKYVWFINNGKYRYNTSEISLIMIVYNEKCLIRCHHPMKWLSSHVLLRRLFFFIARQFFRLNEQWCLPCFFEHHLLLSPKPIIKKIYYWIIESVTNNKRSRREKSIKLINIDCSSVNTYLSVFGATNRPMNEGGDGSELGEESSATKEPRRHTFDLIEKFLFCRE